MPEKAPTKNGEIDSASPPEAPGKAEKTPPRRKTARSALQNDRYCKAKRAVLHGKSGRFAALKRHHQAPKTALSPPPSTAKAAHFDRCQHPTSSASNTSAILGENRVFAPKRATAGTERILTRLIVGFFHVRKPPPAPAKKPKKVKCTKKPTGFRIFSECLRIFAVQKATEY